MTYSNQADNGKPRLVLRGEERERWKTEIAADFRAGVSAPTIARQRRVTVTTVHRLLDEAGVERKRISCSPRLVGEQRALVRKEVFKRVQAGEPRSTICAALRLKDDLVGILLAEARQEAGLPTGRGGIAGLPQEVREAVTAEAVRRFTNGESVREVAKAIDQKYDTTLHMLQKAGVKPVKGAEHWEAAKTEVVTLFTRGATLKEIVAATGHIHRTVNRMLDDAGIERQRFKSPKLTGEARVKLRARIRAQYASGVSVTWIARALGRSDNFVYTLLREAKQDEQH